MQIELTDNQIESLVKDVIRDRIKNYLADKNIEAESRGKGGARENS